MSSVNEALILSDYYTVTSLVAILSRTGSVQLVPLLSCISSLMDSGMHISPRLSTLGLFIPCNVVVEPYTSIQNVSLSSVKS